MVGYRAEGRNVEGSSGSSLASTVATSSAGCISARVMVSMPNAHAHRLVIPKESVLVQETGL